MLKRQCVLGLLLGLSLLVGCSKTDSSVDHVDLDQPGETVEMKNEEVNEETTEDSVVDDKETEPVIPITYARREVAPQYQEMRQVSANDLVGEMVIGWNLGNTFDAKGAETAWGNPYTTKPMIDALSAAGFNTIRIPVTWYCHMGTAPEYKIDPKWIARVGDVIDYCMDNDMYVILDTHHEGSWLIPKRDGLEEVNQQLVALWTQLAYYFEGYGDHLVFEGLNEPRVEGGLNEWSGGTAEGRSIVNEWMQLFVDTVRATGGNNASRLLLVTTFANQASDLCFGDAIFPNDEHIAVSVHAYTPYFFTFDAAGGYANWDESKQQEVDYLFQLIDRYVVSKGLPVIMSEFGAVNKVNEETKENNLEDRCTWVAYYINKANEYGIPCVWWDNGYFTNGNELFGLLDRRNLSFFEPELVDAMMKAATK